MTKGIKAGGNSSTTIMQGSKVMDLAGERTRQELWKVIIEFEEHAKELNRLVEEANGSSTTTTTTTIPTIEQVLSSCQVNLNFIKPYEVLKRNVLLEERRKVVTAALGSNKTVVNNVPCSINSSALMHYGVEIRHIPLARYLLNSTKYVSTKYWVLARDELKFSRCFDRVMELRQSNSWGPSQFTANARLPPPPPRSNWDELLEEAWFMAKDFTQERLWKGRMAKILAEEARQKFRGGDGLKRVGPNSTCFYIPSREFLLKVSEENVYGPGSGITLTPSRTTGPPPTTIINRVLSFPPLKFKEPPPSSSNFEYKMEEDGNTVVVTNNNITERKNPLDWTPLEDSLLMLIHNMIPTNSFNTISSTLNFTLHRGRHVRTSNDIRRRLESLPLNSNEIDVTTKHRAKKHLDRITLMNSTTTKLTSARPSITPKKLNMTAHPSHEAAARKANQNISKLLTPQELALRRIQRTRMITDHHHHHHPSGTIMNVAPPPPVNPIGNTVNNRPAVSIPPPPGSPSQRPIVNATAYQAAVAAAATTTSSTGIRQNVPSINNSGSIINQQSPPIIISNPASQPTTFSTRPPPPPPTSYMGTTGGGRPGMVLPSSAIVQQQRQALLNRSHQIGNYIATMQTRPVNSPLLRPPSQSSLGPEVSPSKPSSALLSITSPSKTTPSKNQNRPLGK